MDLSELKNENRDGHSQESSESNPIGSAEPCLPGDNADSAKPRSSNDAMAFVYQPIERELESVETILQHELKSDTPFVDQLLQHSWLLGGKRIRPVFLLLAGGSLGELTERHFQMAAALEMIHTATLVHDDVLDNAVTRRHRPSVNSMWGTKTSVLLGDYLFTHAFSIASRSGNSTAIELLAQASNRVCEGEMRQNYWQGNFQLTEADYLDMISEKTGELCGAGCRIGALLADAPDQLCHQFGMFGRNLGIAFQIIDDILDVVGDSSTVGKTLGTDLLNQKPTLPVIHCLQACNTERQTLLLDVLSSSRATPENVLPFLEETNSIDYARAFAQNLASSSIEFARSLDPNPHSNSLQDLARFVLERAH